MKSAKKLLLLLLSLVVLTGVFAVAALAEDASEVATVVYPDGSTETFALGETIVGKTFTAETTTEGAVNVYHGEGNTLYKDAGAGWTFTLYGKKAPLEDLTVTEDMLGKNIVAGGVVKVYSAIDIHFPELDYYKWLQGSSYTISYKVETTDENGEVKTETKKETKYDAVYVQAGAEAGTKTYTKYSVVDNVVTETTIEVPYDAVSKRVAGDYRVFFYDETSLQKFFSTSASIELGGVALTYQDLRAGSGTTHNVKLYADHEISNILCWRQNGFDRPNTSDRTGLSSASTGGSAYVYFDLNGHSMTNTSTSYMELCAVSLVLYSSQPGAHFFKALSDTAFYVSDDGTLVLGNKVTDGIYADNLHVHTKSLFAGHYGSGAYIRGGHYYQTDASVSYLVRVSRRVCEMSNASFYVKGNTAVFGHVQALNGSGVGNGAATIKKCNFYTDGTSSILYNSFTTAATLNFENCNFYGVSTTLASSAGKATVTGGTTAAAVTYKTATFFDGTTAFYYPSGADDAAKVAFVKAFVEGHPSAVATPYEIANGNELSYVPFPVAIYTYDENLNATMTESGQSVKVYFTAETASAKTYHVDVDTYENDLRTLLRNIPEAQTVTLYADASFAATYAYGSKTAILKLDLNGYTITITGSTGDFGLDVSATIYFYSSQPNGTIEVPDALYFFRTNDRWDSARTNQYYGYVYFGEPSSSSTEYGDNFTVVCNQLNNDMYSSSAAIYGGTYRQNEGSKASYFLLFSRATTPGQGHFGTIRNATFVTTNPATAMMLWTHQSRTFTDCNFVNASDTSAGLFKIPGKMVYSGGTPGNPTFDGCNFYNVIPQKRFDIVNVDDKVFNIVANYTDCSFGFSDGVPGQDLDTAEDTVMHLAYAKNVVEKNIAGQTYVMNAALHTDTSGILKMSWGADVDFWEVGTKPYREAAATTMIQDGKYYTDPVFDLSVVTQLDEDGFVTEGGEAAQISITFNNVEPIAFTYRDTVLDIIYVVVVSECPDATSVGDKFYELFHAPETAYEIVLYQDMILSQAVPFGKLGTGSQPQYASLANGNITLDLGGKTLTIAEDIAGINMCNSNDSGYTVYTRAVFGLESAYGGTFTLKSSLPNGKIVNPSNNSLICVGERDSNKVVIEGGNLTIDSVGSIIGSFEIGGMSVTVTGGTYTYHGDRTAFVVGGNVKITDATIVLTNEKAISVFGLANYQHCSTAYTIDGVKAYAPDGTSLFAYNNHQHFAEIATQTKDSGKTNELSFENCTLVGITFVTEKAGMDSITYSGDMVVDSAELLALAIPTAPEGKVATYYYLQYNDVDYKVAAYLNSADAGLVNWGFGMKEYWLLGETATHDNVVIDEVFGYIFADVTDVIAGEQKATATLAATKPGAIGMSLTLQSQIGLNLIMDPDLLAKAGVKVGSTVVAVNTDKNTGKLKATYAVAPTAATGTVTFVITIEGGYSHEITVSIAKYAETILGSDVHSAAHKLTYAMVEYVRAMTGDSEFCNVTAPAGYDSFTLEGAASGNTLSLLTNIRFNLSGTIAIEVAGSEAAEGKAVNLVLATGRSEWGTIVDGSVVFTGLYVNEFFGNMTLKVYDVTGEGEDAVKKFIEGEEYTYSLANYLHGIIENGATDNEKAGVQALYNYAHYADAYVAAIKPAAAN